MPPALLCRVAARKMHAYWRAANYLAVGQIYLLDKPPSQGAVAAEARQTPAAGPLGHDAGLNFIYVHQPHDPASTIST